MRDVKPFRLFGKPDPADVNYIKKRIGILKRHVAMMQQDFGSAKVDLPSGGTAKIVYVTGHGANRRQLWEKLQRYRLEPELVRPQSRYSPQTFPEPFVQVVVEGSGGDATFYVIGHQIHYTDSEDTHRVLVEQDQTTFLNTKDYSGQYVDWTNGEDVLILWQGPQTRYVHQTGVSQIGTDIIIKVIQASEVVERTADYGKNVYGAAANGDDLIFIAEDAGTNKIQLCRAPLIPETDADDVHEVLVEKDAAGHGDNPWFFDEAGDQGAHLAFSAGDVTEWTASVSGKSLASAKIFTKPSSTGSSSSSSSGTNFVLATVPVLNNTLDPVSLSGGRGGGSDTATHSDVAVDGNGTEAFNYSSDVSASWSFDESSSSYNATVIYNIGGEAFTVTHSCTADASSSSISVTGDLPLMVRVRDDGSGGYDILEIVSYSLDVSRTVSMEADDFWAYAGDDQKDVLAVIGGNTVFDSHGETTSGVLIGYSGALGPNDDISSLSLSNVLTHVWSTNDDWKAGLTQDEMWDYLFGRVEPFYEAEIRSGPSGNPNISHHIATWRHNHKSVLGKKITESHSTVSSDSDFSLGQMPIGVDFWDGQKLWWYTSQDRSSDEYTKDDHFETVKVTKRTGPDDASGNDNPIEIEKRTEDYEVVDDAFTASVTLTALGRSPFTASYSDITDTSTDKITVTTYEIVDGEWTSVDSNTTTTTTGPTSSTDERLQSISCDLRQGVMFAVEQNDGGSASYEYSFNGGLYESLATEYTPPQTVYVMDAHEMGNLFHTPSGWRASYLNVGISSSTMARWIDSNGSETKQHGRYYRGTSVTSIQGVTDDERFPANLWPTIEPRP